MKESYCVLAIYRSGVYHADLMNGFGKEVCDSHRAGAPVGADFSFAPIRTWPSDVIMIKPQVILQSGIPRQLDWICDKLQQNAPLLERLIADGGTLEITAFIGTKIGVTQIRLSPRQIEAFAKYGAGFFCRFVVNDVFD